MTLIRQTVKQIALRFCEIIEITWRIKAFSETSYYNGRVKQQIILKDDF
jgi:hypothetical protein